MAAAPGELAVALASSGLSVATGPDGLQPPGAIIYGDGARSVAHYGRGAVLMGWRMTIVAGGWSSPDVAATLNTMRAAALAELREAPGWELESVGRDTIVTIAGGDLLACDIIAAKLVTL